MELNFEDIRPYDDNELPSVLQGLISEPEMTQMIQTYLPQMPLEPFIAHLKQLKTIKEFQGQVVSGMVDMIINATSDGLTYSGLENIEKNTAYLFISNHRDIVMDSALISYILNKEGYETARIAIGKNLLSKPWITHMVKLNKSFIVKRGLPRNEMYEASHQLSAYVKKSITEDGESVWIAQREGRSKDGNDRTQGGLINMLGMSKSGELNKHFEQLKIIPVSISYEYDPCDYMKIPELFARLKEEKYVKGPEEDFMSMKVGLQGKKGRIHIAFGQQLKDLPPVSDELPKAQLIDYIIQEIDRQIHHNYKLWPSNYMAADLLEGNKTTGKEYSEESLEKFKERMEKAVEKTEGDNESLRRLFLEIYANPVVNSLSY